MIGEVVIAAPSLVLAVERAEGALDMVEQQSAIRAGNETQADLLVEVNRNLVEMRRGQDELTDAVEALKAS